MNTPLLKFIKKTIITISIIFLADRMVGASLKKMLYSTTIGDEATTNYSIEKTTEDVLVLGVPEQFITIYRQFLKTLWVYHAIVLAELRPIHLMLIVFYQ